MALGTLCLFSLLAFSQAKILLPLDPRIVNGENAKTGEIPYQVSIQYNSNNKHFCGGSILNDNYVITAAHCVEGRTADDIKIVAGTIDLLYPKLQHKIEKIIIHEEYNPFNSWINDIALLKVQIPFTTSATVGHVPLPTKDYVVKTKDVAVVSGWGRIWYMGPSTNKLQRVNIFIADHSHCNYMYNLTIHPTQICAYDPISEKGSCNGDSGGPLTVGGKLIGLVSWTWFGCASTIYPTVYTNVISYLDWIKNNAV